MMYKNKGYKKDLFDSKMLRLLSSKTNIEEHKIKRFLEEVSLGRKKK